MVAAPFDEKIDIDSRQDVNNANNSDVMVLKDTSDENKETNFKAKTEVKMDVGNEEATTLNAEEPILDDASNQNQDSPMMKEEDLDASSTSEYHEALQDDLSVENQEETKKRPSTPTKDKEPEPKKLCVDTSADKDSPSEKASTKKLRCKPEKAKEVHEKMLESLIKSYVSGIGEVDDKALASSVGYNHPRSDAILAATKLGKALGTFVKSKNKYSLTEHSVDNLIPEDAEPMSAEEAMEQKRERFMVALESLKKTPCPDKARAFWEALADGNWHSEQDLLDSTGYSMVRSTGYPEIKKTLKTLEFFEEDKGKDVKKYRFSDKVFPFGRPQTQED